MVAVAVATEGRTSVAGTFLASVTIPVMLSIIMSATAACTYKDVGGTLGTQVSPRLTLSTEGLGREFDPPFTRV